MTTIPRWLTAIGVRAFDMKTRETLSPMDGSRHRERYLRLRWRRQEFRLTWLSFLPWDTEG